MSDKSGRCVGRQGITVLGLLLLILALMAGGFFLVRYLRSRQPATRPVSVIPSIAKDPSAAREILRCAQDDIMALAS